MMTLSQIATCVARSHRDTWDAWGQAFFIKEDTLHVEWFMCDEPYWVGFANQQDYVSLVVKTALFVRENKLYEELIMCGLALDAQMGEDLTADQAVRLLEWPHYETFKSFMKKPL